MGTMRLGLIGLILLLIIVIANSVYIVTDKQTAILLRFGEIVDPKIESGQTQFLDQLFHQISIKLRFVYL